MSEKQMQQSESAVKNIGGEAKIHGFVVRQTTIKEAEKSWPD